MFEMSLRTSLVTGLILALLAMLYANAVGNAAREARSKAAILAIGEALDDGDVEAVRKAIAEYNARDRSPSVIIELLDSREP